MLYHALDTHFCVLHRVIAGKCQAVFIWIHNKVVGNGLLKYKNAQCIEFIKGFGFKLLFKHAYRITFIGES
jgi:hypothetical protein